MATATAAFAASLAIGGLAIRGRARGGLEPIPEAPRLRLSKAGTDHLQVVAATPQGPARGEIRPSVTFDRPVVPLATAEELRRLDPPGRIEPSVPGEWRWLGSATVEFVPEKPLPLSTAFLVVIRSGLTAVDGSELETVYPFKFETPRPTVNRVSPGPGWRWVAKRQKFSLTFDQPVEGLEDGVELVANGEPVPVSIGKGIRVLEEEIATAPTSARRYLEARRATDTRTRYEISPKRDLPLGASVRLSVGDAVHGAAGPLGVAGTRSWTFQTYGPMAVQAAQMCQWGDSSTHNPCPFGPLVLRTSNKANAKDLRKLLKVDPPVELDWDRAEGHPAMGWDADSSPYLVIPGKFRPATTYRITLAPGLPDEFDQASPAWQGESTTSDLSVLYDLGIADVAPIQLLEAEGDGAFPLKTVNVDTLDLRFWKLTPASAAAVLASERPGEPPGLPIVDTFRTNAGRNVVKTQPLSVRGLLGGARTGLFFLEASTNQTPKPSRTKVLGQLTNLAVHAKLGVTSGVVWVTRVSDGAPVQGAEVSLHDASGSVVWHGETDQDGLVQSTGLGAFGGVRSEETWRSTRIRRVVSASKDGDTGLVVASWERNWPGEYGLQSDSTGGEPVQLGLLVAERGIYRPGEKVHLKGFFRYRARGEIRTPAAGTVAKLVVRDAKDAVALEKDVALSRFGTFDAEVDARPDAPLGTWQATASTKVDGVVLRVAGDLRVEEYRAPQFRVDVTAPSVHIATGDRIQAQVLARYLFGAALSDAPVKWHVVRKTLDFRPPRHEAFHFGVQAWWWDDGEPAPSGDVVASGTGRTDSLGGLGIEAGRAEASADRTWEYDVEAEVEDLSRQTVADRAQLVVHPASLYAGVRRPSGFARAGKPITFELVAVTPAGQRKEAKVSVEVRRREWKWIKKKVAGDHWATVSEPVEEAAGRCTATPGATSASCSVTPEKPGFHIVEVRVQDEQGRTQVTRTGFYVVGDGWVAWQRGETDKIDLVPDKASYEVGDVARILVKSPYPVADALLSVEREGVMSARRVDLKDSATVLEVPIGEDAVPNVYVGLVVARGRVGGQIPTTEDDPGRPDVKTGYVQLKVERAGKRLSVQVSPNATEFRPRQTVKLDLAVKDAKGRGVPAEITVWAVDEGVLRLTGYKLPDLIDAIHPPRGLAVRSGEPLRGLVLRKLFAEKGFTSGGGGGGPEGAAMRSRFKTTPLFAPSVLADAAGRAHVEFQLPDNLTAFRIMAVAITEGDLAGGGQANISVARPLLALPALPRAARVGDRFEAGVVVHSPGAKVDAVDVTADVKGLRLEGPPAQHVTLGGKPKEVRFRFVAEEPGQAVLRFQVRGGQEADGVEQRLKVTDPISMVATALQGETDATGAEKVILPKGVRTDVGGVGITLASTVLGGFAEGMTQLVDYPYGCLEQLSSRLVPFIALRELSRLGMTGKGDWLLPAADRSSPGAIVDTNPDEVVRKTINAIESRQQQDGSYRFWDGGECSDPWASAYAAWSLSRADRAGYRVDRAGLRRAEAWLAGTVLAGRALRCGTFTSTPTLATRVFALFALARSGQPKASYHAELYAKRDELSLFSKAMLADAMARAHDLPQARSLLDEVLSAAKVTTAEVHLEEGDRLAWAPWSSDTRSTAMALQALLVIRPDHPFLSRMVAYLSRARRHDGRFRNTQEAAYTLTALSELVRVREAAAPAFTAKVSLGGKQVASQEFRGRSLEVKKVQISMADLLRGQPASASLPFTFERSGDAGTLYYGALLKAAPAKPPVDAEEHGLFVQRWLEPWQGGGQVRATKAGEVLRLRVRVSTPQQRNFVAVEVPLPSGLEAVDTSLATSARLPTVANAESDASNASGSFWSPFNHVELRDDRVLIFADHLPAGLHTYSLPVRATTPGAFLLAPAHGEEMYAPEVYGRSGSGVFTIAALETAGR